MDLFLWKEERGEILFRMREAQTCGSRKLGMRLRAPEYRKILYRMRETQTGRCPLPKMRMAFCRAGKILSGVRNKTELTVQRSWMF